MYKEGEEKRVEKEKRTAIYHFNISGQQGVKARKRKQRKRKVSCK